MPHGVSAFAWKLLRFPSFLFSREVGKIEHTFQNHLGKFGVTVLRILASKEDRGSIVFIFCVYLETLRTIFLSLGIIILKPHDPNHMYMECPRQQHNALELQPPLWQCEHQLVSKECKTLEYVANCILWLGRCWNDFLFKNVSISFSTRYHLKSYEK